MTSQPTQHTAAALGARDALAAQVTYVDAVNDMINQITFNVMTKLADALTALAAAISAQLQQDAADQQAFVDEWAGNPNNEGNPSDPTDPNNNDKIWSAIHWLQKYGKDTPFAGENYYDLGVVAKFLDWWKNDKQSPHKNIGSWLDTFHEKYNTDQLNGQNKTAAAQKPVNLWNQTISDENKTTISDYEMMKSFKSIFQNLNAKTGK